MIKIVPLYTIEILAIILVIISFIISSKAIIKRGYNLKGIRKQTLFILHIISLTAFLGLILQPQLKLSNKEIISSKVRLITNNSTLKLSDSNYPTFTLAESTSENNIIKIKSPQQILIRHPELAHLEIIGDGLSDHDWEGFENIKITYQQPEQISGLLDVSWNKVINLGETLKFSARFHHTSKKLFTVQLLDPAGDKVAETKIRPNEHFNLSTKPKMSGLHQYKIKLLNDKSQVLIETINFEVLNQSQAKILILQSSPSFETKQLQNWASEHGAKIMIKTQISKGKYITRLTNLTDIQKKISPQLFNDFDMLIIGGRALINLSSKEINWLTTAVSDGLGVLVLADNELINTFKPSNKQHPLSLLQGYQLESVKNKDEVILFWPDNNGDFQMPTEEFLPKLSASISITTSDQLNIQRLVESETNELIVSKNNFGLGQVSISLIKSTYSWVTSGNSNIHSQYWSHLIASIARKSKVSFGYSVSNTSLYFAEKLTEQCLTSEDDIKQLTLIHMDDKTIKHSVLLQKGQASNKERCGYFWPQRHGWYQVTDGIMKNNANMLSGWQYIEDKNNWLAIQQMEKIKATLSKSSMNNGIKYTIIKTTYLPINLWYFWWMFFISAGIIWLERKLDLG